MQQWVLLEIVFFSERDFHKYRDQLASDLNIGLGDYILQEDMTMVVRVYNVPRRIAARTGEILAGWLGYIKSYKFEV